MRSARRIGLGPFLRALEARLEALSADEIRQAVLAHAERLPPRERDVFLAIFPEAPQPGSDKQQREPGLAEPGDRLLSDIDRFVAAVRDGAYVEGWGWDDNIDDERAYGDESWVGDMDDLLAQAGAAFLDGELQLAREAYRRLLHAFLLDEDAAVFSGPQPADEMVDTNLTEAKARYLRAIYTTTTPNDRAEALAEELKALDHVGDRIRLQDVIDATPRPMPDLAVFLPAWIERLTSELVAGGPFITLARVLLSEGVEMHEGPDGLGALARARGPDYPELFEDWIAALVRTGRRPQAIDAAKAALGALTPHGEARARIAEACADLAIEVGDVELVLEASQQAWRAAPSRGRLLDLMTAARSVGRQDEAIATEADVAEAWLAAGGAGSFAGSIRQACEILLLAWRVEPALAAAKRAEPLGWSRGVHPGPVVVPFLLVAGSVASAPDENLLLSDVFDLIDAVGWPDPRGLLGERFTGGLALDNGDAEHRATPGRPRLSGLLAEQLDRHSSSEADRRHWLAEAQVLIERRISAVVEAKHRHSYAKVALLAVGCGEALQLTENAGKGAAFVADVRARYPRHTAFHAELDRATRRSALLPSPPRKGHAARNFPH